MRRSRTLSIVGALVVIAVIVVAAVGWQLAAELRYLDGKDATLDASAQAELQRSATMHAEQLSAVGERTRAGELSQLSSRAQSLVVTLETSRRDVARIASASARTDPPRRLRDYATAARLLDARYAEATAAEVELARHVAAALGDRSEPARLEALRRDPGTARLVAAADARWVAVQSAGAVASSALPAPWRGRWQPSFALDAMVDRSTLLTAARNPPLHGAASAAAAG